MSPPLLPQDITMTETEETVLDLEALRRWFDQIPAGPFDALHTTTGWEVRQLDTDPTNKHHWPFRLCSSVAGQTAGCDEAVFSFIAGVINAWPAIDAALSRAPEAEDLGGSTRMTSPASRSPEPLPTGWFTMDVVPGVCRKFIALYNDGSGAAMFWRHDDGLIDHNGAVANWPLKGYDRWAYLPDDLEFWCETCPEDPMVLPRPPAENSLSGAQRSELTRLAQDEPVSSPPSTGGEGEANQVGAAEAEVGRYVYRRIERLMDAKPGTVEGAELCYLAEIAEGVEEYGEQACDGHPLGRFPHPSPEMGEISREEIEGLAEDAFNEGWRDREARPSPMINSRGNMRTAWLDSNARDAILSKFKENGLSREGLGGLARSQPGSDAQERSPVPPLSDGEG